VIGTAKGKTVDLSDDVVEYEQIMERLMAAYKGRMFRVFKAEELTPPQFYALVTIARLKRTKMSPLADELGLSMGAASTLVDRLVQRGLVERDTDVNDRRAVFVSLSVKGDHVLKEAHTARRGILTQVFGVMVEDDRRQVIRAMEVMAQAWESLGEVEDPGLGGCIA
jgi:DNA-binding MarR family transcriptional regulator